MVSKACSIDAFESKAIGLKGLASTLLTLNSPDPRRCWCTRNALSTYLCPCAAEMEPSRSKEVLLAGFATLGASKTSIVSKGNSNSRLFLGIERVPVCSPLIKGK